MAKQRWLNPIQPWHGQLTLNVRVGNWLTEEQVSNQQGTIIGYVLYSLYCIFFFVEYSKANMSEATLKKEMSKEDLRGSKVWKWGRSRLSGLLEPYWRGCWNLNKGQKKMEAMLTGNKMMLGWTKLTWSLGITSWQEIIATKQDLKLVLIILDFKIWEPQ